MGWGGWGGGEARLELGGTGGAGRAVRRGEGRGGAGGVRWRGAPPLNEQPPRESKRDLCRHREMPPPAVAGIVVRAIGFSAGPGPGKGAANQANVAQEAVHEQRRLPLFNYSEPSFTLVVQHVGFVPSR